VDTLDNRFIERDRFVGRQDILNSGLQAVKHGLATIVKPLGVSAAIQEMGVPEVAEVPHSMALLEECAAGSDSVDRLHGQSLPRDLNSLEQPPSMLNHLMAYDYALTGRSHTRFEITHVMEQGTSTENSHQRGAEVLQSSLQVKDFGVGIVAA
jgi:hypothetical protein